MSRILHIRNSIAVVFFLFNLTLFANINIGNPDNITECFQSTTEGFDLTINNSNVLDGLDPNLYSVYYFDNQSDSNNNNISNAISNPTNYSTGNFELAQVWVNVVEDADESNFDNSTFLLITNETPEANNPGFNFFGIFIPHYIDCESGPTYDLTFLDDSIIGDQEGSFIVTYFENEQDANNNVNAIANPENYDLQSNVNSVFTNNLVARIEFDDSSSCFNTTSFTFSTYQSNNNDFDSTDITKCANEDGTAVFDLTETFVENNNNLDISNRSYDVYDEDGNQIGNSIFNVENYSTNTFEELSIEIRNVIRLNPNITGFCVNIEAFIIQAFEVPQVEDIQDITACSLEEDETTFNLTLNDDLVIGNQEGNYNVSYHFTLPEANAGTNSVTDAGFDPSAFTLDNFEQFMFVRIENVENPSCFSVDFFTLEEADNITADQPGDVSFCSSTGENSLSINLTQFDDAINISSNLNDFVVDYFLDDELVEDPTDFIINSEVTTITAVVFEPNFPNCFDEVTFDVLLNQTPEIQNLNDLEVCSDFDLNTTFNLTENTSEALGTQDPNEVEVTYFSSLQDAEDNINSLESQNVDLVNYTASSENESIFIRLQNTDSANCFVVDSFELQSFPVGINEVDDLVNCTESGETSAFFDLSQVESELLPTTANSTDYSIAYFDENDVEINNPENYEATSSEIITIEIANVNNPTCAETTSFNLLIEVTPEIQNLNDLEVCNGFDLNTTFNLTENTSEALGTQDPNEVEVAYFSSLQDAEDNINSLESQGIDLVNYTASSENESIFIRLQNTDSANCFVVDSFELQSFPLEINEVDNIEECIDAESLTATFNLTNLETTLFGSNQDSTTHSINFFDENGNEITSTDNFSITNSQTISAQIINIANPTCFESTSINLITLAEDNPDCTLSINQEAAFEFKTYPNPVTSQLIIESNESISKIEVFDIKGKKVTVQTGMQIKEIDFSNIPTGIYLLKLEVGNRSQITKIIKK